MPGELEAAPELPERVEAVLLDAGGVLVLGGGGGILAGSPGGGTDDRKSPD